MMKFSVFFYGFAFFEQNIYKQIVENQNSTETHKIQ